METIIDKYYKLIDIHNYWYLKQENAFELCLAYTSYIVTIYRFAWVNLFV